MVGTHTVSEAGLSTAEDSEILDFARQEAGFASPSTTISIGTWLWLDRASPLLFSFALRVWMLVRKLTC